MTPLNIKEFLADFSTYDYPDEYGKWMAYDQFDPPFTRQELRKAHRLGIIDHDEKRKRFRLTMKATQLKNT